MKERQYQKNLLFMGILSTRGFPDSIREKLVDSFGPISYISPSMPFTFTDYYNPEMGEGIERFFISFSRLISPDALADAKTITNAIELDEAVDGKTAWVKSDFIPEYPRCRQESRRVQRSVFFICHCLR